MKRVSLLCLSPMQVFDLFQSLSMLGLNWVAFQRIKRQNTPGPFITTLYRDGVLYVAAIVGKRCSHCFFICSLNISTAFSLINSVMRLTLPVSSSHSVYRTTLNPRNTEPIRRYPRSVEPLLWKPQNFALLTCSLS